MEKNKYQILKVSGNTTYQLPIYLESTVDEMGVMVEFDGDLIQVEQLCNFSYTQTGSTIQVYNTVDSSQLRHIVDQVFTISWGDGNSSSISVSQNVNENLPTLTHTYSTPSIYTISISLNSPWNSQILNKSVTIPQNITVLNSLGTFSGFTIPYTDVTGQTQDYINDLDYTNNTGYTTFSFAALGRSRISELKLYGSNTYSGVTGGTTVDGIVYSAYTIDNLTYVDYSDGITSITGRTNDFQKEEVFNQMLTRNEHFIGFIDDPVVYSDIFVERGKLGIMENNLRLGEIDNTGELEIYGDKFFNVKKQ